MIDLDNIRDIKVDKFKDRILYQEFKRKNKPGRPYIAWQMPDNITYVKHVIERLLLEDITKETNVR